MKTIVRFQIFLISNLNQPGHPQKITIQLTLDNDVDELFKPKLTLPRNNISQHDRTF